MNSGWRGGEEAAAEQVPMHQPKVKKFLYSIRRQNFCHLIPLSATVLNKTCGHYHGRQKWLKALKINSSVLAWYLQGNAAKTLTSNKAESVQIGDVQHNPLVKSDGESPGTNSFLLNLQTRRQQERDEWINGLYISFLWNAGSEVHTGRGKAGVVRAQPLHADITYGKG